VHDYLKGGILYVYIKQASHLCTRPPCLLQLSLVTSVHFWLNAFSVLQAVHLVRKARILNPIFSAKSQVKVRCHHISWLRVICCQPFVHDGSMPAVGTCCSRQKQKH
jgi:hypothetical protein